jgi:diguanylate cyclase (GGDEF)-like protein
MSNSGSDNSYEKTRVIAGDQETLNNELSKAKEQDACLIIIRGTPQGHRYFITQGEMTLGRDPQTEITVNDQSVSRRHAKVTKVNQQIMITDLGSANGTFINDKKLSPNQPQPLAKEDMVKLGNTILKYLPAGELEIIFYGNLGSAANQDPLTKIYNKRFLLEAMEAEFKRAKALHQDFSMIFFDLDHFKKVNDTHGHEAGDLVLREFAQILKNEHVRTKDIFARYGGEEFVLLLGQTNAEQAKEIAERIRVAVETYAFIYEGTRIPVTTSLGVAEISSSIESAQTLLKNADRALYSAKSSGRNRVVVSTA